MSAAPPPADPQQPPAEASASKGKLAAALPIVLALVGGLALGAGTGAFVTGPVLAAGIAPGGAPVAAAEHAPKKHKKAADDEHAEEGEHEAAEGDEEEAEEGEEEEESGEGHGEKKEGEAAAPNVHTLDNLVLNPAESGGTRFLLLSISFQAKDAAVLETMKARDAELRDMVLVTIGNRTVEQLADMAQRDSIKKELRVAAGKLLKKKTAVKRIFFPQFVIQ